MKSTKKIQFCQCSQIPYNKVSVEVVKTNDNSPTCIRLPLLPSYVHLIRLQKTPTEKVHLPSIPVMKFLSGSFEQKKLPKPPRHFISTASISQLDHFKLMPTKISNSATEANCSYKNQNEAFVYNFLL